MRVYGQVFAFRLPRELTTKGERLSLDMLSQFVPETSVPIRKVAVISAHIKLAKFRGRKRGTPYSLPKRNPP